MSKTVNILCTRPIDPSLIASAGSKGIAIEVRSFIETVPVKTQAVQEEIEKAISLPGTVVFTSMNAVDEVAAQLKGQQPQWRIYSIGDTTTERVKRYFGEDQLAGTAHNAAGLGQLIIKNRLSDDVIFFCGNQRRDELPLMLRDKEIAVKEIEVYQTIATPHKMDGEFDAILFFSPSAVNSFFSNNTVSPYTLLFAIGQTTAETIKNHTRNKIIIPDAPGKDNLVNQAIAYLGEP